MRAPVMPRTTLLGAALMGSLALEGCAEKPVEVGYCGFRRLSLALSDPDSSVQQAAVVQARTAAMAAAPTTDAAPAPAPEPSAAPENSLAGEIATTFKARAPRFEIQRKSDSMLFLSGGSLHGAYGAGFLAEWQAQRPDHRLPEFAVVTGVSTGALLATFAFVSRTDLAVQGYTITDETDLLTPYTHLKDGKLGTGGAISLLRKGALANLNPLRARLNGLLSDDVMRAVAEGAQDRRLYVGVVNIDTGEAEALDLTNMAHRYVKALDAHDTAAKSTPKQLKDCYVEAIIASASAPVAAPPVFIDNREYVDGGERFGVFSNEVGKVISDRLRPGARNLAQPTSTPVEYVIVNGTQQIDALCAVETGCPPNPGAQYGTAPHAKWSILDLALRSGEDILPNQVYRFSADQIAAQAQVDKTLFKFTKLDPASDGFRINIDNPASTDGRQSCADYRTLDMSPVQPLQFYPRYMRCIIDFGRESADQRLAGGQWDPEILVVTQPWPGG